MVKLMCPRSEGRMEMGVVFRTNEPLYIIFPLFGYEWPRIRFRDESAEGWLLQGLYDSKAPYLKPYEIHCRSYTPW